MRVLVTGGAGFIGSHVVDLLVETGHDVSVVDNLATGKRSNLPPDVRFYEVDLNDHAELLRVFRDERPDVVSHQAAQASVPASMADPIRDARVNVLGSLSVLEACRRHGVGRMIYAGTGGAAVGEPRYLPVDEDHPVQPLSPYGANKHAVEHYCSLYQTNWGIDTTILRYANVYGPRQDPLGEAGVISIFAARMLRADEQEPIVNGSGEQERDYVYVADVANANLLSLERGVPGMFNIGTGVGTSVNELFDRIAELTGYSRPRTHGPAMPGEVFKIMLSTQRAQAQLGWTPRVSLHEGLRLTVQGLAGAA